MNPRACALLTLTLTHTLARLLQRVRARAGREEAETRRAEERRAAMLAKAEADLKYCEYLCLITGEGTRAPAAPTRQRPLAGLGARDWDMEWDLELSNWEFRPRAIPKPPRPGAA
ncbi:MAG: hypothetical protein HYY18_00170 [Planctomycetes bacterium]|nr:hypothetical protein [Planctomycetota bacterium]